MWKVVGGAVLGYLAMVAFVMATFTALWLVLGQEAAFRPGTSEVTPAWLAGSLPLSFLAAILGGWVAARVGGERRGQAVLGLMGLVLLMGVVSAVSAMGGEPAGAPAGQLGPFEAAAHAVQPVWYNWIIPLVGAAGVWLGGRIRPGRGGPPAEPSWGAAGAGTP